MSCFFLIQANYKYILHGGSSDHQVIASSSAQPMVGSAEYSHEFSSCKLDGEANKPAKWMSWKMRMMNSAATDKQERITPKFHDQEQHKSGSNSPNNGNNTVRVCSDCSTTKTPLWRSGPQGPKVCFSLPFVPFAITIFLSMNTKFKISGTHFN